MAVQGGNVNLQGGTGISLGNYNPQQTGAISLQNSPATGISLQGPTPPPAAQPAAVNVGYTPPPVAAPVYAPNLNLLNLYNQQAGAAGAAVNPYYTLQLQQFQAQQAADKATQQQQTQTNIQNLQTQLANTLQGNSITQARTAQDTLQNEQQAGIQADQTQQTQGTQFDQARIAQAKQLAGQGLTTSGLGAGQVLGSETDRNTQEAQQAQANKQAFDQSELLKSRTFEDLARSGDLATKSESTGETQANFDLNNFIAQQGRDYTTTTQNLEKARLQDVAAKQTALSKLAVNNFIQSLSNPAQRLAAVQQYGSAF